MGNENLRDELRGVFDRMAGSPSPALPDRVRSAVSNTPEARGPYWLAAVAAVVIAVLLISVLVVANNQRHPTSTLPAGGNPTPTSSPSAAPTPSPSPSPSPAASPSASPTPDAQLPPFVCASSTAAAHAAASLTAYIDDLRTGTHAGYDRLTIEFSNGGPNGGVVELRTQDGTTFMRSPIGDNVTLKGQKGILIVMHGADLHTSYSGSTDIVTGYATMAEVRQVEDYEGVVQIALGLNGGGCYRAFWLSGPDRLVIDVQAAS